MGRLIKFLLAFATNKTPTVVALGRTLRLAKEILDGLQNFEYVIAQAFYRITYLSGYIARAEQQEILASLDTYPRVLFHNVPRTGWKVSWRPRGHSWERCVALRHIAILRNCSDKVRAKPRKLLI